MRQKPALGPGVGSGAVSRGVVGCFFGTVLFAPKSRWMEELQK